MAKLVFHVGMPKTGSSAIQLALAGSASPGFVYPQLAGPRFKPHHTDALIQLFSSASKRIAEKKKRVGKVLSGSEEDAVRIRQAAADAGDGTVVLSSEGAYSFLSTDDLTKFKSFADEIFSSTTVVAYVREPFSFISSNFQNKIKTSQLSVFVPSFPHYRHMKKFDAVFGEENVQLWEYDRSALLNGNVVEDFCSRLGIQAPSSQETNHRLSRPAISAIYRLNRAFNKNEKRRLAFKRARAAIISDFPHGDFPPFRLAPELIETIIADNDAEMDWIEQRIGRKLRAKWEPLSTDVASEADLLQIDAQALQALKAVSRTLPTPVRKFLKRALAV